MSKEVSAVCQAGRGKEGKIREKEQHMQMQRGLLERWTWAGCQEAPVARIMGIVLH